MRGEKVMIELATLFMLEATIILGSQLTGYYRPARTQSVSKTRILFSLDIVNKAGRTRCCEVITVVVQQNHECCIFVRFASEGQVSNV